MLSRGELRALWVGVLIAVPRHQSLIIFYKWNVHFFTIFCHKRLSSKNNSIGIVFYQTKYVGKYFFKGSYIMYLVLGANTHFLNWSQLLRSIWIISFILWGELWTGWCCQWSRSCSLRAGRQCRNQVHIKLRIAYLKKLPQWLIQITGRLYDQSIITYFQYKKKNHVKG